MLSLEEKRLKHNESNRKSREKNKENRALYNKEYEKKNAEKIAARKKEYWAKNGAKFLEKRKTPEHRERVKEYRKSRIEEDPDYRKHGQLKYLYGISLENYNAMFASQNGCCAICGKHQSFLTKTLHVDHCHKTGKVRGLLCMNCNHAIGKFEDSPDILNSAINYLMAQPGGSECPAT